MKIFAAYLTIDLAEKPGWLDDFRKKNNAWFEFHITLIQPRYIEDDQIENLKARISEFLKDRQFSIDGKRLSFDEPVFDESPEGKYLFMWFAKENLKLTRLQKDMVDLLKDYDKFIDESTKEYETNFKSHITIAENIDADQKSKAEMFLSLNSRCEGIIKAMALPIIKNTSKEERENKDNIVLYEI